MGSLALVSALEQNTSLLKRFELTLTMITLTVVSVGLLAYGESTRD
jgi:hypothetical protein